MMPNRRSQNPESRIQKKRETECGFPPFHSGSWILTPEFCFSIWLLDSAFKMKHTITLIPGDGIGPEVSAAVVRVVESLKIITEKASTRVSKFAFEYARREGRKKVTAIHKANIMKLSDGLFLDCFRNVSKDYPAIEADDKIVDNACMQLVMRPEQFDVMLLENLYGDIVSDLCAGLVGGLGLVPGANIGERGAVFEAVHGSAPDIAGQGIANPTALLQSSILMLRHIGERDAADKIERALMTVFEEGKVRTRDIGGTAKTAEFADAIISKITA